MAYRDGNRYETRLLPLSIENYIAEDDPVRAYDCFINALNIEELGIEIDKKKVGNSSYNPKAMLKLIVYSYSYGLRSSRKIERALYHNLSFIWLVGGLKPDHKTIAEFRRNNKEAIKKILVQSARMCIKLELIEGNTLFLDGSKMRGNASINQTITIKHLEKNIAKIEERIDEIMKEAEKVDSLEKGTLIKMKKELKTTEKLKTKLEKVLEEMKDEDKEKANLTDKECINIKGRQGIHAGYNAQVVVDEKHGLIVSSEVVSEANDFNQFTRQIDNANEVLEKECKTACADSGYSNSIVLKEAADKGIEVIVPNIKQAQSEKENKGNNEYTEKQFSKDKFEYNKENDEYICPEGNRLKYVGYSKTNKHYKYQIKNPNTCRECKYYNICTKNKRGRTIDRLEAEETKESIAKLYETERGKEIYRKRKEKIELPFGHIKRNLNGGYFLLRGKKGANAEMSVLCTCFNIVRMITLLGGVCSFIKEIVKIRNQKHVCNI